MTGSPRALALVHLLANALLLWLGYYWLGLAESRASTLAWSLLVALILVSLAGWVYGSAFACLEENPWRTALRNLLPFLAAAILVTVLYLWLSQLDSWIPRPAAQIASWLTLKTRRPVRPQTVLRVFQVGLWLVRWVLAPVALLPVISAVARRGWRGFRWRGPPRWYWIQAPLLLLLGLWVPLKLIAWVPRAGGFGMEAASFVLRASTAYFLFVAAGLLLAFLTSGGKPRLTQSRTAGSP